MGEFLRLFRPSFNRSLRVDCRSERLTGDPGAVLLREVLDRSGVIDRLARRLRDPRRQEDVVHDLASLLRTTVLLAAHGWRDHDDATALRTDPAFRLAASSRSGTAPLEGPGLASQPTLSRLSAMLATRENLAVLRDGVLDLACIGLRSAWPAKLTLDVDSLPIEVHGHQPGSEWNGHYSARIYHPLVTSVAETGDMLDARLRPGNAHTADGALGIILDVVDRVRRSGFEIATVRMDAGFPSAPLLDGLEARGIDYVARLRANSVLDAMAAPYMRRPPGRRTAEPRIWLHELEYRAESWSRARRVMLVVLERPDELLLDRFFLLTSLPWSKMPGFRLLEHYRRRGKAEGHMGELKDVLAPALSSTNRPKSTCRGRKPKKVTRGIDAFGCNEVRLLVSLMAYQVMHIARRAMEAETGTGWSLRRVRERVLRGGGRLVLSGRRMTLVVAAAFRPFWAALWSGLSRLPWPAPG